MHLIDLREHSMKRCKRLLASKFHLMHCELKRVRNLESKDYLVLMS